MAQTGYTPLQIYSSSTGGNAPAAGNLTNSTLGSELAINITDGKLFYKDNAGVVQVIAWKVTPATAGGTGQTSYTQGDLLYATSSTTLGRLADVATGNALISGGVGGDPAWGKIGLTTHVSGVLPTANGGTNLSSFTANGVLYASSTSALATGSAFTFDGTNVSSTGSFTSTKAYANTSDLGLVLSANIPGWNLRASGGGRLSMVTGYIGNDISSLLCATGSSNPTTEVMRVTHSSGAVNFISSDVTLQAGNLVIGTSGKGITTGSAIPLGFGVNGSTTQAMIDTNGNFLVGQTVRTEQNSNSFDMDVQARALYVNHASGTASTNGYLYFGYNAINIGSVTQNGTTGVLYNITSDHRLKNNPVDLTGAKDFIMALKPKKWQWWDGSGEGVGFIAHEFMEIAKHSGLGEKDAVNEDGKPIYQSIQPSSSEVMANLVSIIQEQQNTIDALKMRLDAANL